VSVVIASNANEARDFDARLREIHAPVAPLTAFIADIAWAFVHPCGSRGSA